MVANLYKIWPSRPTSSAFLNWPHVQQSFQTDGRFTVNDRCVLPLRGLSIPLTDLYDATQQLHGVDISRPSVGSLFSYLIRTTILYCTPFQSYLRKWTCVFFWCLFGWPRTPKLTLSNRGPQLNLVLFAIVSSFSFGSVTLLWSVHVPSLQFVMQSEHATLKGGSNNALIVAYFFYSVSWLVHWLGNLLLGRFTLSSTWGVLSKCNYASSKQYSIVNSYTQHAGVRYENIKDQLGMRREPMFYNKTMITNREGHFIHCYS